MRLTLGRGASREQISFASGRNAAASGQLTKDMTAVLERRGVKLFSPKKGK